MRKKYLVGLTVDQRADLEGRFAGPLTLRQRNRVQVLRRADAGDTDADIADDLGITPHTAANVRKRFAADGLEAARSERPRTGGPSRLDGKAEAVVAALRAARCPTAARPGRPGCWRASLSNCTSSRACPRTRSSASSKKRPQAVAEEVVVPAEGGRRRVRLPDGGRA